MIDIHSHLLPGVDDGSPSVEVSVPILERFGADGVELLVCTPHLNSAHLHRAPYVQYLEILEDLRAHAPALPRLELGWEIMLDGPGADLRAPELHLARSTAVLVEFPRMNVPPGAAAELGRIRSMGVVPVVAHPERYWGCTVEKVRSWREAGAVIQMDAALMLGDEPKARVARALLEAGLVDCVASDNHGDRRSLGAARQWLCELGAEEQAQTLTHTNAERLLANLPMLPVQPLPPVPRGMGGRLRELLFGRP